MMDCSAVAADLADLLAGSAAGAARERAEAHLAECAACRATAALWEPLGELDTAGPAPALERKFRGKMERRAAWSGKWMAVAAAVLVGVFSFAAGRYTAAPAAGNGDVAALRGEVRNLREMVALSLLEQQSASERLRGVRYSASIERPEPELAEALTRTLRSDPSVDVRLAAAEALGRVPMGGAAEEEIWKLLETDDSPLVQIAVIDLLAGRKDPRVRARLEKLRDRNGLDKNVREYLQALLSNQRMKGNSYQ
jgi:hypothetical protein